ncbi:DNA polymerase III subunit gamma/tau [Isosphaeraceae bacterium EP7]
MARLEPTNPTGPPGEPGVPGSYTVVARRYRPARFEDVVGQDHVVQALRNAIRMNRVTHAYLFSGTRGVGKTSLARIFAKCLNCVNGPTSEPCLTCDICRSIASGQDVDVIEIDGASNNGVEAVRELRQNAGLRPSRARFKIYYIDEVHMLSTGAFNALLKTLEEPPSHVKFFFATTEANKIPVTVLSRCQRYDLAGIAPDQIMATLAEIAGREGIKAEPEALSVLARRASGSMRDAQSLLEQLLSAGQQELTVEVVHQLLGTASDERTLDLLDALSRRDPAQALMQLESAVNSGVQPADLLNGALEFLRDVMVIGAGAGVALLAATPRQHGQLREIADRWGLDSSLAAMQILAEARTRLRGSPHGRLLVELALARVARLEDLSELGDLVTRLAAMEQGGPPPAARMTLAPPEKKKLPDAVALAAPTPPPGLTTPEPPPRPVASAAPEPVAPPEPSNEPVTLDEVLAAWPKLLEKVGLRLGVYLVHLKPTSVESGVAVIGFRPPQRQAAEAIEAVAARNQVEEALASLIGRPLRLQFDQLPEAPPAPRVDGRADGEPDRPKDAWRDDPLVRQVQDLFEAKAVRVEVDSDDSL